MNRLDTAVYMAAVFLVAFLLADTNPSAAQQPSDFYGTWIGHEYFKTIKGCKRVVEGGEGDYFVVKENFFRRGDNVEPCQEAKTWMTGTTLRASASCEDEETGFVAMLVELKLKNKNTLIYKGQEYFRCIEP